MKGVNLLGTGDCQHPKWFEELKTELKDEHGTGVFRAHGQHFLLTTEISLAYSQGGRGRRVHLVVLLPNLLAVKKFQEELLKRGRIDYDGRPIFGMSCPEFVDLVRGVDERCEVFPAHAWTPWFGVFGDKSGFDSLQECFQDNTKHIHAIETGISSDPAMNWRLGFLDDKQILSFSDCHSHWPWRIGRECTVFDLKELTFDGLVNAIRTGNGLESTIEFFPEEGKYHFDGHRNCNIMLSPEESKKHNNTCPECKRPLTIGVLNRVTQLATHPEGRRAPNAKPFTKLMTLPDLIAASIGCPVASKKMWELYGKLLNEFGNEFTILLDTPLEKISQIAGEEISNLVLKNRKQEIQFTPGYDGVYGSPIIEGKKLKLQTEDAEAITEKEQPAKQKARQKGIEDF